MPFYQYTAIDLSKKKRRGQIEASDEATALKLLTQRSMSEIELQETEPPPPPVSGTKKFLLALVVLCALGGFGYLTWKKTTGPPDFPTIYRQWDQAVRDGDVDKQYQIFADKFVVKIGATAYPFKRRKVIEDTKAALAKAKAVRNQETRILSAKNKNGQWFVVLDQRSFSGQTGSLATSERKLLIVHLWKYIDGKWVVFASQTR